MSKKDKVVEHLEMLASLKLKQLRQRIELRDWAACVILRAQMNLLENIFINQKLDMNIFEEYHNSTQGDR